MLRIDFLFLDEVAAFTISKNGNRQLIRNGYKFTKNVEAGRRILWRCVRKENKKYICKASASTYEKCGIEYASFNGTHDHPPNNKAHH